MQIPQEWNGTWSCSLISERLCWEILPPLAIFISHARPTTTALWSDGYGSSIRSTPDAFPPTTEASKTHSALPSHHEHTRNQCDHCDTLIPMLDRPPLPTHGHEKCRLCHHIWTLDDIASTNPAYDNFFEVGNSTFCGCIPALAAYPRSNPNTMAH